MDHNIIQAIDENQTLNFDFPALPHRPQPQNIVPQTIPIINSGLIDQGLKTTLDGSKAETQEIFKEQSCQNYDESSTSDFPALPHRPLPENIALHTNTTLNCRLPGQGLKRSFDDSLAQTQEVFTEPLFQADDDSSTSIFKKKVIKLSYREPNFNLDSLPSLSSLPSLDFGDSNGTLAQNTLLSPNEGLGSLGVKFGQNATLDSLPASQNSTDSIPSLALDCSSTLQSPHNLKISLKSNDELKATNIQYNNPYINNKDDDNFNQRDTNEDSEELTTQILHKLKGCKKNRGHEQFSLIQDLKVRNLPREIQHEDALTFLSCMAQLVVQISVTSTSAQRDPGDDYQNLVGTNKKRFGSGFIHSVDEDIVKFRCKQKNCQYIKSANDSGFFSPQSSLSSAIETPPINDNISLSTNLDTSENNTSTNSNSFTPKKKHHFYGGLNIHTNRHIIYDKSEADNAIVKFFFNTPDGQGTIEGHVGAIIGVNSSQDHVILHVMSHDKSLFQQVEKYLQDAKSSYRQMIQSTVHMQRIFAKSKTQSWVAVVSHPHGLAKHISFGHVIKEEMGERRVKKYYDAGTCPGSSGGLVMTPSLLELQWPGAVHRMYDKNTMLNVTWDSRYPDLKTNDMERIHKRVVNQKEILQ